MSVITTERRGDILVITSDNPPVNALSAAVRQGLAAAFEAAEADDAIAALVLCCRGRTFFAGADITEFGKPPVMPLLPSVIERAEALGKPIVAAIHGTALGGGCELALGCHYRVAVPTAKIGTPEVKLGLLPGAGGTQRLPRLVGVALALEMCARGEPISAARAHQAGLIDRVVDTDDEDGLLEQAIAFAEEIAAVRPIPRVGERELAIDSEALAETVAAFRAANERRFRGFDAPEANIRCVERAAQVPLAEGLQYEREEFSKLIEGEQSAAMRHLFFAERKAAKIDDLPAGIETRAIARVGIIGAGTMGGGIAMNFVQAGVPVTLVETSQEALDRGLGVIAKNYQRSAAKGRFTPAQVESWLGLLTGTLAIEELAECDLIIEAVFEDMAVKTQIFAKLDEIAKPGAILATNTSYLDIDEIAASISRPGDVLGTHFFSPANVMKLLELVRGARTAPDVLATVMALAKKIRKVAVVSGVCHGFIGNRMLEPRQREASKLLLEGATPEQVDAVHVAFGMPMGPFQMADLAGVDIGWHRDPERVESVRDQLCAEGRWGQKKGAGFYDYDERRQPSPSPRVGEIIAEWRERLGVEARAIDDDEIVARTLYPMVNEGARILAEGIAQRASDIDVVWVYGYGWPVYRGGPMFWADSVGAATIVAGLERYAERSGIAVAPLLREKASQKQGFRD